MKKLATTTGFVKTKLPADYPYTRTKVPTYDNMDEWDEIALANFWPVSREEIKETTDDYELTPSEQLEQLTEEQFKSFPDSLLILNDVYLHDVPVTAIKIQSITDVFVGETLRTQAPVISSEGRQDFILNITLTFPPGDAQAVKLKRLMAEITRHPLVFVHNNRVKKAIGAAEFETTMFILETGGIRSTSDSAGTIILDLQMHYFNHKPFSNHFYFNARVAGFSQPRHERVEQVDIPISLGDFRGYEGSDYSISLAEEKLKADIREGALSIKTINGTNVPVNLPSESDAWMYYANHLEENFADRVPREPSDYIGFILTEYRYFNPPKTATDSLATLSGLKMEYPDPQKFYKANEFTPYDKTAQERVTEELTQITDPAKEIRFKNVKTNETIKLKLLNSDGSIDRDSLSRLSSFANTGKYKNATPLQPGLALHLHKIATQFQGRTIEIISGSRFPKRSLDQIEREEGKAKRDEAEKKRKSSDQSLHLKGRAMDLRVQGIDNGTLFSFLRTLSGAGAGYYPNSSFCHIDSRSTKAEWIDMSGKNQKSKYLNKEEREIYIKTNLQNRLYKNQQPEADDDAVEISNHMTGSNAADQERDVAAAKSERSLEVAKSIEKKKSKTEKQQTNSFTEGIPKISDRDKWIANMASIGWFYYSEDNNVRNVFYREHRADISSNYSLHKQGLVFPNIVCTGISVNFGHRIVPMRLLSQSSYTYQFLGAGNKSGQMVFTFAGETGRQSADKLKKLFYLARQNARFFNSLIRGVGSIGLSSEFGLTGEINTVLALLGVRNIVVSNIEEVSLPDGVDKHQLVIEFIVQDFAKEKYEKKFVTSIESKQSIIRGILKHLKVRESKQYNDLNKVSYSIYPSPSIAKGSSTNIGLYTVSKGVPKWVADLVIEAAKICHDFDQKMPPINWKTDPETSKTWRDIYAQWGAEKVFHGRNENISFSEKTYRSNKSYVGQADIDEWMKRNNANYQSVGGVNKNEVSLADAKRAIREERAQFDKGTYLNNGGPGTNAIHKEVYNDWLLKMENLARKARQHVADEQNFEKFIGPAGVDILATIAQGLGECYEDMLLPRMQPTKLPFAPEFYVYDDSDENPTLSSLTDKDNMILKLKEHSRVERESIELYARSRFLGGSYVSKNLPRILANRQIYEKNFREEFSFMDNWGAMLSEGANAWEPIYYRSDMEHEESEGIKVWRNKINGALGSGSEDQNRLNFMDGLISLNPYIKGNQWQDKYYDQDIDKQKVVESLYGDDWNQIAFGPNPEYGRVDAALRGEVVPTNDFNTKQDNVNRNDYSKAVPPRGKVSDGTMVVGQAEEDIGSKDSSILDKGIDLVVDAVDTITDSPILSFLFGGPIGITAFAVKRVVQSGVRAYNNIDINKSLQKLDHPDKEKLNNVDVDKEISTFATNNAIGSKYDDISIRRVYPTFKIYFIEDDFDETERVDGQVIRAFDDFYSYSAVQEIRVTRSRKIAADIAVIRLTNIGGILIRKKFGEMDDSNPKFGINSEKDGIFSETDKENPFARMIMQDGVKVQIRLGYSGDPDKLETVFLGQVVEISPAENGKILEIMCQGYGAELESIELGPLEDGPVYYSTQEALSAAIIQDSIINFGRYSKYSKYNPAEIRHAFTGGRGEGILTNLDPTELLRSWSNSKMEKLLNKYTFMNLPQDDNIFAPPPSIYATNWDRFSNNACIYRPLKQTPWQIFQEHELRHPGYISLAVPYGHSPRMTMFFGGKLQHYWAHPPSAFEIFLTENAHNHLIRMRGMSVNDENGQKILEKVNKLASESTELAAAVLEDIISVGSPKRTATALAKQFGRYRPFRNYHYLDSEHHILQNEIRTSVDGTFNEVELLYFEDEDKIEESDGKELQENLMDLQGESEGFLSIRLDENLPESSIRSYRGEFPSCVTDTMARRYTQGIFARHLRDAYKGELIVIGKETLKPYDVCYINDSTINMTGPIEVESVTHIFNRDHGFISIITPDLCVEVNDMFASSVFDVAAAGMAWSWGWGDVALLGVPGVGATVVALKGVAFLGLCAGVKFGQWTQDGAPVVTTPLTFGGKPFLSVSLGPKYSSLFFNLHGKWDQFWDDAKAAAKKFDLAEAMFDAKLSIAEKALSVFGTGLKGDR